MNDEEATRRQQRSKILQEKFEAVFGLNQLESMKRQDYKQQEREKREQQVLQNYSLTQEWKAQQSLQTQTPRVSNKARQFRAFLFTISLMSILILLGIPGLYLIKYLTTI